MDLRHLLEDARAVKDPGVRAALLEEVIAKADPVADPALVVAARLDLAHQLTRRSQWLAVFDHFDECLRLHDAQPWHFTGDEEERLLTWYTTVIEAMTEFPDVPLSRIEAAMDDVERRLAAGDRATWYLTWVRRRLAQDRGDRAAEAALYVRWQGEHPHPDGLHELPWRIERLVWWGEDAAAAELVPMAWHPELAPFDAQVPVLCQALLPLARAGRLDDAVAAHRAAGIGMARDRHPFELFALCMEFCALTGNCDVAFDLLSLLDNLEQIQRPAGRLHYATAVAVLTKAYMDSGRAAWLVGQTTPMWLLHERMRTIAVDLAAAFDARNGSTAFSDRTRARLDAEPIVAFLPLRPGSVPFVDVRPPPGLSDAELLERCRRHERRGEVEAARACLEAVREGAGPLLGHVLEMKARLHASSDTRELLHQAVDRHRAEGRETLALLAECWLGLRPDEPDGHLLTHRAAEALLAGADDDAAAWAVLWYSYVLAHEGRDDEAYELIWTGIRRAAEHPLTAGFLARVAAAWGRQLGADPDTVRETAEYAVECFVSVGAARRAVEAVDDASLDYIEALWNRLPAGELDELRGRLAYHLGDHAFALGQAVAHHQDYAGPAYGLLVTLHAEGRTIEALDLGLRTIALLERAGHGDHAHFVLADCYDRVGDHGAALVHYQRLIDGFIRRGDTDNPLFRRARAALGTGGGPG
jgi:hypothetical protein